MADRALCSRKNLADLEQAQYEYVVAMPLRRSLNATQKAEIQETRDFALTVLDDQPLWVREFDFEGKRLKMANNLRCVNAQIAKPNQSHRRRFYGTWI